MNTGDGGLARHNATCTSGIDWEDAGIIGREKKTTQQKYLEGIMTLKERSKGIAPLNSCNQMEPKYVRFWETDVEDRIHCVTLGGMYQKFSFFQLIYLIDEQT